MKKALYCFVVLALLVGMSSGCVPRAAPTPAPAPVPEKPITLKLVMISAAPLADDLGIYSLQRRVYWETKGRVFIDYIGGAEAVPVTEQTAALRRGVIQINLTASSFHVAELPDMSIINLSQTWPLGHPDAGQLPKEVHDYVVERYKTLGMYFWGASQQQGSLWHVFTKKEVKTLADLKGLKIGSSGKLHPRFVKAFGGVPVDMEAADYYSAVQTGLLDGIVRARNVYQYSLHEVLRYVVYPEYKRTSNLGYWINLDTWNELGPDLQQAMSKAMSGYLREAYIRETELAELETRVLSRLMNIVELKGAELEWYAAQYDDVCWAVMKEADPALYQNAWDMVQRAKETVAKAEGK